MRNLIGIAISGFLLILCSCNSGLKDWELARDIDTIQGYENFIANHPDHDSTQLARDVIFRINFLKHWEESISIGSIEAYNEFQNKYPNSEFQTYIDSSILVLKEKHWQEIENSNNIKMLEDYIEHNKDGIHIKEARKLLNILNRTFEGVIVLEGNDIVLHAKGKKYIIKDHMSARLLDMKKAKKEVDEGIIDLGGFFQTSFLFPASLKDKGIFRVVARKIDGSILWAEEIAYLGPRNKQ